MEPRGQHVLDLVGNVLIGAARRIHRHGHHRHLEAAPRQRLPKALLGYQVRQAVRLFLLGTLLGRVGSRGALALVPRQGTPLGHQQAAPVEGPVAHLGVLAAPLVERTVEPADLVEEPPAHPQVAAGHDAEQVVVG